MREGDVYTTESTRDIIGKFSKVEGDKYWGHFSSRARSLIKTSDYKYTSSPIYVVPKEFII